MSRKKLTLNATTDQVDNLIKSLNAGTPLTIALQYANISTATYYYWVAIYSVVVYCKEQEELNEIEKLAKSGIHIQKVKDMAMETTYAHKKSGVGTYIEPTQESVLQYRNSKRFRDFADQIYEIIAKCNRVRSTVAMQHLINIQKSTTDRHINASGSMWFLERTMPDFFSKPSEKKIEGENETKMPIDSITVEFINPDTDDSKKRLVDMENQVLSDLKGSGDA